MTSHKYIIYIYNVCTVLQMIEVKMILKQLNCLPGLHLPVVAVSLVARQT